MAADNAWEQLDAPSRRALVLAEEEARRLGHNFVGPEHLLLGLVRERDGVAARALTGLGVHLPELRATVESMLGRGEAPLPSEIRLTPRTTKVLGLALDEARGLQQPLVGTEHLLLAIAHEGEGIAAAALEHSGIRLGQVHTRVMRMIASA